MKKLKIVVIAGPTAVGKTSLGITLAKKFNGEIISGDSMQIYRHLDIGTAKASPEEREGIPHHLIDEVDVQESYTVSDFQKRAKNLVQDIAERGKIPIVVGGTGLYIESLLYDVSFGGQGESNPAFRKEKEQLANEKGTLFLWEELHAIDPEAAASIPPSNSRRVTRALEVYHMTGKPFSTFQKERETKEPVYDAKIIGLNTDRQLLYDRINQRVEHMLESGLLEEAKWLYEQRLGDVQSVKGIGYKELSPYFEGNISLQEAKEAIQQNSRRYAKRQLTWFRNRTPNVGWWNLIEHPEEQTALLEEVGKFLEEESSDV